MNSEQSEWAKTGRFPCRFTKLQADHDRLNEDVYEGIAVNVPQEGACFYMAHSTTRVLNTSPVVTIEEQSTEYCAEAYLITTYSGSKYLIENLATKKN